MTWAGWVERKDEPEWLLPMAFNVAIFRSCEIVGGELRITANASALDGMAAVVAMAKRELAAALAK